MLRRFLLAAPLAFALALTACGGDSDDSADNGDATQSADSTSTPVPTPTDAPLPSPTPVPDDFVVVQVVSAGEVFAPTRSELVALGETTIAQGGKDYTGVSIGTLAAHMSAREGAVVTIEGTRSDNLRLGVIRFTLDELAETTVLTVSETGHLDLASSFVPPEQWLMTVTGISFD